MKPQPSRRIFFILLAAALLIITFWPTSQATEKHPNTNTENDHCARQNKPTPILSILTSLIAILFYASVSNDYSPPQSGSIMDILGFGIAFLATGIIAMHFPEHSDYATFKYDTAANIAATGLSLLIWASLLFFRNFSLQPTNYSTTSHRENTPSKLKPINETNIHEIARFKPNTGDVFFLDCSDASAQPPTSPQNFKALAIEVGLGTDSIETDNIKERALSLKNCEAIIIVIKNYGVLGLKLEPSQKDIGDLIEWIRLVLIRGHLSVEKKSQLTKLTIPEETGVIEGWSFLTKHKLTACCVCDRLGKYRGVVYISDIEAELLDQFSSLTHQASTPES